MKDASQYPVTHPFGATYDPWSKAKPHLGEDRPTPMNTPLLVNKYLIGLTGRSGRDEYKPHLHTQRVNKVVISPLGNGFSLPKPVVVVETGEKPDIGKFIRLKDGVGDTWSYFHLSEIKVTTGQRIGEES